MIGRVIKGSRLLVPVVRTVRRRAILARLLREQQSGASIDNQQPLLAHRSSHSPQLCFTNHAKKATMHAPIVMRSTR